MAQTNHAQVSVLWRNRKALACSLDGFLRGFLQVLCTQIIKIAKMRSTGMQRLRLTEWKTK